MKRQTVVLISAAGLMLVFGLATYLYTSEQADRIEAFDGCAIRDEMADVGDQAVGIEGGDKHRSGVGRLEIGDRLGGVAASPPRSTCLACSTS